MTNLHLIFKTDKEKILKKLEYYGIKKLPYLLCMSGKEKIRGYSGSLSKEELIKINKEVNIEIIGLYLFHSYEGDSNMRLSFDAIYALKDQITKNIIELEDKQAEEFLKGRDLLLTEEDKKRLKNESKGFKILSHKGEFIGSGKFSEERIINYMPKERRLR